MRKEQVYRLAQDESGNYIRDESSWHSQKLKVLCIHGNFDTWNDAMDFIRARHALGERGWRIRGIWEGPKKSYLSESAMSFKDVLTKLANNEGLKKARSTVDRKCREAAAQGHRAVGIDAYACAPEHHKAIKEWLEAEGLKCNICEGNNEAPDNTLYVYGW